MSTSIPTDLAGGPGAPEIYQPGDLSEVLKKLVGGNDFSGVLAIDDREKASDFIALAKLLVSLQNGPDDLARIVALLRNHRDLEPVAAVFKSTLEAVLSGSHLPKVDVNFADVAAAQGVDALSAHITTVGAATLVVQKFIDDVPGLNILLNKVNLLLKWFKYLPQYEKHEQAQAQAKKDVEALVEGEAQQAIAVVGAQLAVSADPGKTILPDSVAVAAGALGDDDLVAPGLPFVKARHDVTSVGVQSSVTGEPLAPLASTYSGGPATDTVSGGLTVGERMVLARSVIPFVSPSVVEQYNLYIAFCERWRAVFDKAVANDEATIKDVFELLADIHLQSFDDVLDKLGKISSEYFETAPVNFSSAKLKSLRDKCTKALGHPGVFAESSHQTIEECSRALDVMLSDFKSHSEAISKGAVEGKIVSYHPYTEFLRTKVIPTAQAQLKDLDRTEAVRFAGAPGGFPPQLRARIVAQLQPLPPRES